MRFSLRAVGPWLIIVTLTAAGAAAAAGYALTAPKQYRATAQLLVTPVPAGDPTYIGLDLLRSGTRRTAAASAAALLESPQVADAVRAQLGLTRSRDDLLAHLDAEPVDDSDVVAVTFEDTSAAGAAQLANAFADALVSQRTASFQSQLSTTIRRYEQLLRTTTGAGADELRRRLVVLRGLQGQPDPTLRSAAQASAPESATWPKLPRLVAIGALIGLAAGVVVALLTLAARRARSPGTSEPAAYDRRVPERVVGQLEKRLQEKVDALVAERERLDAREKALAAREGDVTAKLDELRAAAAAPAASTTGARELEQREAALEARIAEVTRREVALAKHAAAAATAEPEEESDLAQREADLSARVAALTRREVALARRAASITARERELEEAAAAPVEAAPVDDTRERELDEREAELAERERELTALAERVAAERDAVPAATPVVVQAPPPVLDGGVRGAWNLTSLERLVEERAGDFPDRIHEWSSYLYFLREYADADGSVPASFDILIEDTFAEILEP